MIRNSLRLTTSAAVSALICITLSSPALAYVGPGAGLSLLGALWGVLAVMAMALGFLLVWPIRRLLRQRARRKHGDQASRTKDTRRQPSVDAADS